MLSPNNGSGYNWLRIDGGGRRDCFSGKKRRRNFLEGVENKEKGLTETVDGTQRYRQWEFLDHDILVEIFDRNFPDYLFESVSVCRSWQRACLDVLSLNKDWVDRCTENKDWVDLSDVFLIFKKLGSPIEYQNMEIIEYQNMEIIAMHMIKIIFQGDAHRTPLEHWSRSVHRVYFPTNFEISDKIFIYIAKRTPNLRELFVPTSHRITKRGFLDAIGYWKEVSSVSVGPIDGGCLTNIFEHMGRNWNKLVGLDIYDENFKLAKHLPKLNRLVFVKCCIFRAGMDIVRVQCAELEVVIMCEALIIKGDQDATTKLTGCLRKREKNRGISHWFEGFGSSVEEWLIL